MAKQWHEIRDPIHVFVRVSSAERDLVDSRPFQRLRHVHQLAMTYLVYPGATHRRFEHSLGVMELASRVYDVVTRRDNVSGEVKEMLPELGDDFKLQYWGQAIRIAALCHDLGHLPFSHAAEKALLPPGESHESMTARIVRDSEITPILKDLKVDPEDVVKLALGPQEASELPDRPIKEFSEWEAILAEIIAGDAFGVDRMDYLLRDSHHVGVAYGRFDHYRLVDTLRILPAVHPEKDQRPDRAQLGIEGGGLQSSEALMLARYLMFSQVYFHHVRRIYDIHLKDFLVDWLENGRFPTDVEAHLAMTDNEVLAGLSASARDSSATGYDAARRVSCRDHFRVLYERNPDDVVVNPQAGKAVFDALTAKYGPEKVRHDQYAQKSGVANFPVAMRDGRIASALAASEALRALPVASIDYVFACRSVIHEARAWLEKQLKEIIQPAKEDAHGQIAEGCNSHAADQ